MAKQWKIYDKEPLKNTLASQYTLLIKFLVNYAAIHKIKLVLILNKPIYVGFIVLELSKCGIYDFHYNFITKILMLNYALLTQTILLFSENIYQEFFKWKDLSDFSNYSKDSKIFDETNKKVIGKMKDEFGGIIVNEFFGLKSKMYSIKKNDGKECNTAKGVSIATEFNKFKDVLLDKKNY